MEIETAFWVRWVQSINGSDRVGQQVMSLTHFHFHYLTNKDTKRIWLTLCYSYKLKQWGSKKLGQKPRLFKVTNAAEQSPAHAIENPQAQFSDFQNFSYKKLRIPHPLLVPDETVPSKGIGKMDGFHMVKSKAKPLHQ